MPITVKDLMQSRKELALVTAKYDEPVQNALEKMREKDFSQLPVVSTDGKLIAMITSNSILNALQTFGISMSELRVSHAAEKHSFCTEEDDLSDVFNTLRRTGAVIIQAREGQRPIGIITTYDMSEFYSQRAENIILLNNIETTLKEHIRAAFTDQVQLAEAIAQVSNRTNQTLEKLKKAIKHYQNLEQKCKSQKDEFDDDKTIKLVFENHFIETKASKSLEDLSLNNFIDLVLHESNSEYCELAFNNLDKTAIRNLLINVRDIRNALFHFRREILVEDHRTLRNCSDWLARHPAPKPEPLLESYSNDVRGENEASVVGMQEFCHSNIIPNTPIQEVGLEGIISQKESRYVRLAEDLKKQFNHQSLTYYFKDIEKIIEDKLPKSAREDRSWWSNDESQPWVNVGWYVLSINMMEESVTFVRKPYAKEYTEFFQNLLEELSEKAQFRVRFPYQDGRHYITVATLPDKGIPVANLTYSFNEYHQSFRVELFIDKNDSKVNKEIFDFLEKSKEEIESTLQSSLLWEPMDTRPSSRISLTYDEGSILVTDSENKLEKLKNWAVDAMMRFQEVMNEYIKQYCG